MKPMEEVIFKLVKEALERNGGSKEMAAQELGITRKTIFNYSLKWPELKKYIKDQRRLDEEGNANWRRFKDE